MADAILQHDMPATYEPSLFGTYSKKIGMWRLELYCTRTATGGSPRQIGRHHSIPRAS
jgi:hypothetical protein